MAETTETVHAVNADQFRPGTIFGWPDKRSETGYLSGIVVSSGPCFVTVRDIRAAVIGRETIRGARIPATPPSDGGR